MKTRWYKDLVVYQIYPRSFYDSNNDGIGDINGIISKLDYIKSLGVGAIWLSPIFESPNYDNGYDISNYKKIDKTSGTFDDFKNLVKKLKELDIKLILDMVVNHTSSKHPWFIESKKGKDNPYRDYYIWRKGRGKDGKRPPNNWTSRFTGSAWTYDDDSKEWYLHLFGEEQPDLNWENEKVRKEVIDIFNFWFENGADGFRCDAITYISKNQKYPDGKLRLSLLGDENFVMFDKWHDYIKEVADKSWNNYDSFMIAEGVGSSYEHTISATKEQDGLFDSFITFDHLYSDYFLTYIPSEFNFKKLKYHFNKWQNLPRENWHVLYYENHDQPRSISRFIKDKKYYDLGAKMLATSYMLQRGTPFIFQGQEIAMTNSSFKYEEYSDKMMISIIDSFSKIPFFSTIATKLVEKRAREHGRTPMQWNNKEFAGFSSSKPWIKANANKENINVEKQELDENSVLNFYRKLIDIRTNNYVLKDGTYHSLLRSHNQIYAYERVLDNKVFLVLCNFSEKNASFRLNKYDLNKEKIILSNYQQNNPYLMKPYESRIYEILIKK